MRSRSIVALRVWHHLAPLSSSHGCPNPQPPCHSQEIREEGDTWYIMYKINVPWPIHVVQRSSLFLTNPSDRLPILANICKSWRFSGTPRIVCTFPENCGWRSTSIYIGPPRIRPPAMNDNILQIDEGVEPPSGGMTYHWAGQLATGCLQSSPLTSSRILAPS